MRQEIAQTVATDVSPWTDQDVYLFREGTHYRLYEKLGSHVMQRDGKPGIYFAVWAPNARSVAVIGEFNHWNISAHPLAVRWDQSGIWEGFIAGLEPPCVYKYHIVSHVNNYEVDKADPFAFACEVPPATASRACRPLYDWNDAAWMQRRAENSARHHPMSIYEVHIGSWKKRLDNRAEFFSYRDLAPELAEYARDMGFTHVQLLPVMEHPFYGSWGYQTLGYFAPSARYGSPEDFMYLVDTLHQQDIGVILDWVPSHFPSDEHGLGFFDGTYLFEHADIRRRIHPDWQSCLFNYGRNEVRSFLISSGLFWLDRFHADGLRVDAVASMLYLDYSRKEGQWTPNRHGGREDLEAIDFLRQFNEAVYQDFPHACTIAEESTSWPMVSRPVYTGGLGFGMKWNMGWMHDTLAYLGRETVFRKYHQSQITFAIWYAFNENFVLPLSHDEVVHGKGSLINKMPGDPWQKFANLRALFGYMFTHPGKKLLFMGSEFGQLLEWNHQAGLQWDLLDQTGHVQVRTLVRDLNRLYRQEPALHELDFDARGFAWVDFSDSDRSIISYLRKGTESGEQLLVVCNFTPGVFTNYRLGAPFGGRWREIFNSDADVYGGSGAGNLGGVEAAPLPYYDKFDYTLVLTIPPLSVTIFKPEGVFDEDV